MRRWRKRGGDEDDVLTFDGLLEEEDDAEEDRPRRRYVAPRPIKTRFHNDSCEEEGEDSDDGISLFEELEPKIRSGKYKPSQSDPWTAHILYQSLRDLGEI